MPPALVSGAPDIFKAIAEQKKAATALNGAPRMSDWLGKDPLNGQLAKDDLENLTWFERNMGAGGRAIARGRLRAQAIPSGMEVDINAQLAGDVGKTFEDMYAEELAKFPGSANNPTIQADARRKAQFRFDLASQATDRERFVKQGVESLARATTLIERSQAIPMSQGATRFRDQALAQADDTILGTFGAFAADPVGGAAFLAETAAEFLPVLAVASATTLATRSPAAGSAVMGSGSFLTEKTNEAITFLQERGVDMTTPEGALAIFENEELLAEARERGLERGLIIAVFDLISGGVAGQALAKSPAGDMVAQGLAQVFLGGAGEGFAGLSQGEFSWKDTIIEGLAELATLPVEVMGVGGRPLLRRLIGLGKSGEAADVLTQVDEMAQASRLKERAPDRFLSAMQAGGLEEQFLYVPAESLQELFQAPLDGETLGALGVNEQDFREQLAAGGDVAVPLSHYAANIAGTEQAEWFKANAVMDPDEMSATEAQDFNERVSEIMSQAFELEEAQRVEEMERRASDEKIRDDMFRQLRAAGRSVDVATREAAVWSAFFRTMGERTGQDPISIANSMGVEVRRVDAPNVPTQGRPPLGAVPTPAAPAAPTPRPSASRSDQEVAAALKVTSQAATSDDYRANPDGLENQIYSGGPLDFSVESKRVEAEEAARFRDRQDVIDESERNPLSDILRTLTSRLVQLKRNETVAQGYTRLIQTARSLGRDDLARALVDLAQSEFLLEQRVSIMQKEEAEQRGWDYDAEYRARAEDAKKQVVTAAEAAYARSPAPAPRPSASRSDQEVAITASGREVPVRYRVVEASSLVASQTDDGRSNPAFPAELQPRDRSRGTSAEQVRRIAENLDPRLLANNPSAADGAPIIGPDGVVESGNGRVLAIRQAYASVPERAAAYRDFIASLGYDVEGIQNPVLVRERQGDTDRQAFTREANERSTMEMSDTERGMSDAAAMPDNILALYRGGDIDLAQNREFVRAFISSVVSPNDQGGMIDAQGRMSQRAVRRVQAALLAKAYGDATLVERVMEVTDGNIKAIGGALMDAAPQWAQMRREAAAGTIAPEMDQTDALMEAVNMIRRARDEGRSVSEFVGQTDIFSGEAMSPIGEGFLRIMFRDPESLRRPAGREKMASALAFYVDEAQKTSPGVDLLGETADPAAIVQAAKEQQYGEGNTGPQLFQSAYRVSDYDGTSGGGGTGRREGSGADGEGGGENRVLGDLKEDLQNLTKSGASPQEIRKHPLVVEAEAIMANQPATFTEEQMDGSEKFDLLGNRTYVNKDGKKFRGLFELIPELDRISASWAGEVRSERKAVVLIGPPAAGKSTIAEKMIAPQLGARILDADEVKKLIPEYNEGIGAGAVHEESSAIAKEHLAQTVRTGDNIVLPKVGDNAAKMEKQIRALQGAGYSVELVLMDVEPNEAFARMIGRFLGTGRLVVPDIAISAGTKPPGTYQELKKKGVADGYALIDNNVAYEEDPIIVETQGALAQSLFGLGTRQRGGDGGAGGSVRQGEGSSRGVELFQEAPPERSQEFKDWFGDSKVVDENGDPLVAYHGAGTLEPIDKFAPSANGLTWFTMSKRYANMYARRGYDGGMPGVATGAKRGHVLPVYLSVKRPYWARSDAPLPKGPEPLADRLRANGYDAFIPSLVKPGTPLHKVDEIAVVDPTQIKSVFNRGTWAADDPRILYQGGPENDLLRPAGESRMIGPETVLLSTDDLVIAEAQYGGPGNSRSFRYIRMENGEPVGTLQFATKGPRSKKATIQNVYVREDRRRQKVAANLLRRAQEDFDVKHSDDLTNDGRAFKSADGRFYQDQGEKRGSIQLPSGGLTAGKTVINLFETADLSTFLHESGHFFLEAMNALASAPGAPAQIVEDAETIRKFLGAKAGKPMTTAQHEKWARGFEAYLMEGKAPSLELADAFSRFKAWLTRIYKSIAGLDVKLNDEIRAVMDRMLATDEEIAAARADMQMSPLFTEKAPGMSDTDWSTYQRMARRGQEQAEQRLLARTMAKIHRERQAWYKEELASVTEEVEREINAQPVYRLTEMLGNQRWIGRDEPVPDMRIDKQALVDQFGEGIIEEISRQKIGGKRAIYGPDGSTPAEVAEFFGFPDAGTMMTALQNAGKRTEAIATEAERRMDERHGDVMSDGSIEEAALAAVHSEQQAMTSVAEARHLAQRLGRNPKGMTAKAYRARAREMLGRMSVSQASRPSQFLQAERKAARKAQDAFARTTRQGGTSALAEALQAKEQQVLNGMLYDESRQFAEELKRGRERMRNYDKKDVRKKLEGGYIEQIDAILDDYDFRVRSRKQVERAENLQAFIDRMIAEGREAELNIDQRLMDEARRKHYSRLSVDELRGLFDTVENLDHMGRRKQKLIDAKKERDLLKTAQEVEQQIRKAKLPKDPSKKYWGLSALNLLRRPDTILVALDDGEEFGAVYEAIKLDIDQGQAEEQKMQVEMATRMDDLFKRFYDTKTLRKMQEPKQITDGRQWSKAEIIAVALNTGNEDNYRRLMDKNVAMDSRMTPEKLDVLLREMDDNDWKFVQALWDEIDSYWPQLAAVHKRRTGVAPEKVKPKLMVSAPPGVTGGYYPIKYDPGRSQKAARDEATAWDKYVSAGHGSTTQVANGMTRQREKSGGGRTLLFDLSVPFQHLRETVRFIALSEAVDNAYRVLNHPLVFDALQETGNADTRKTLNLWLQDTARGPIFNTDLLNASARFVKNNFTLARLAFNMKTVILQTTGLGQSAATIGHRNMVRGMVKYAGNMPQMIKDVTERSAFMAERQTTFQKDIYDFMNEAGTVTPMQDRVRRGKTLVAKAGFWPMIKTQFLFVDMPTWVGAYDAGLQKYDGNEERAALYADRMVARAQDSGMFGDRAAVERGTVSDNVRQADFIRMFTTLGGYMLTKTNRAMVTAMRARAEMRDGTPVERLMAATQAATDMMVLFAFEAVMMGLIYALMTDEEDEEDLAKFLLTEIGMAIVGGIPLVRDAASAFRGYGGGGVYGSVLEAPADVFRQAVQGEADVAFWRSLANLTGNLTGLPTTAAVRLYEGAISENDASLADALFGRNPLER